MNTSTATILAAVGGVFYFIGGLTRSLLESILHGVNSIIAFGGQPATSSGASPVDSPLIIGLIVGLTVIVVSLSTFDSSRRVVRMGGGCLVIVVAVLGSFATFGGLVLGLIMTVIAGIGAITYAS